MCSSTSKLLQSNDIHTPTTTTADMSISDINGRPVLQPATPNRNPPLSERRSLKKTLSLPKSISMINPSPPKPKSPAAKRDMNSSSDKLLLPPPRAPRAAIPAAKRDSDHCIDNSTCTSPNSAMAAGSIAAARREQVAVMQVQRKMKIAHYGRSKSARYDNKLVANALSSTIHVGEEKRSCSFITPNSDPIYVAYHDEEWGVPARDDKMLFELLVLTGAQVGSDWTSVLQKRKQFREAFSGFDAEIVSKYSKKRITSICNEYGIEVSLVLGVVDNSKSIIETNKAFGSFHNYIWGFVNHKPIATQYKSSNKMPVKTSKAEAISKDMVRRGFRQVGPTVIHSFMQAAGLTNDHLTTCSRHLQCAALASTTTPTTIASVN